MPVFLTLFSLSPGKNLTKSRTCLSSLCFFKIVFWVLVWSIKTLPRTQAIILFPWVIKVKIDSRQFHLLLISFLFIYLCMCHIMYVEAPGQHIVFSFHCVGLGAGTQVIRLACKYIYILSHLAGLLTLYLWCSRNMAHSCLGNDSFK